MYENIDNQQRAADGRWWCLNPRRVSIDVYADVGDWDLATDAAASAQTTVGAWVCDKIEQAYIDYATAKIMPTLMTEDPDAERRHFYLRTDFAVRSMVTEMAQVAGVSVSRIIRAIIADALLRDDSAD